MDFVFINSVDKLGLKNEVNGTMLLATILLQNGFSADVLRYCQSEYYEKDYAAFVDDMAAVALSKNPGCVSFYSLWPYFHINLAIAKRIKELSPHTPIAMGGPLTTLYPQTVLERIPWVDFVCCGEGENTIVPFAQAILAGGQCETVPGLWYRADGKVSCSGIPVPLTELDTLPQWDKRLVPYAETNGTPVSFVMPIDVGRGCPFNCTFCCSNRVWKRKYRLKSPERIVEDIRYHYDTYGIRNFQFSHDAFTVNSRLVSAVCDLIIESGMKITWDCTTRVNCINEELVQKMMESGMNSIQMGVESGSLRMQQMINKKLDLDHLRRMVSFLRKNKIKVSLFFMYGFPEETEEDLAQTVNLFLDCLELGVGFMSMALCKFNPGTEMTDTYFDRLRYPDDSRLIEETAFGYAEAEKLIKENKELFPFFYHLDTPIRNTYHFLNRWAYVCRQFPGAVSLIRPLYGDQILQFYKDFIANNPEYSDFEFRKKNRKEKKITPKDMLINAVGNKAHPNLNQLKSLIDFLDDQKTVSLSKSDTVMEKVYGFSYLDYIRKLPLDAWTEGKTTVRLSKTDGKMAVKILDMQ